MNNASVHVSEHSCFLPQAVGERLQYIAYVAPLKMIQVHGTSPLFNIEKSYNTQIPSRIFVFDTYTTYQPLHLATSPIK
jgi:hypothetical protein